MTLLDTPWSSSKHQYPYGPRHHEPNWTFIEPPWSSMTVLTKFEVFLKKLEEHVCGIVRLMAGFELAFCSSHLHRELKEIS